MQQSTASARCKPLGEADSIADTNITFPNKKDQEPRSQRPQTAVHAEVLTTSVTDNAGRCHLLSLPAELRNRIYDLTLESKKARIQARIQTKSSEDSALRCYYLEPALTRTCRQIRKEALPIHNSCTKPVVDITIGVNDRYCPIKDRHSTDLDLLRLRRMWKLGFSSTGSQKTYSLMLKDGVVDIGQSHNVNEAANNIYRLSYHMNFNKACRIVSQESDAHGQDVKLGRAFLEKLVNVLYFEY